MAPAAVLAEMQGGQAVAIDQLIGGSGGASGGASAAAGAALRQRVRLRTSAAVGAAVGLAAAAMVELESLLDASQLQPAGVDDDGDDDGPAQPTVEGHWSVGNRREASGQPLDALASFAAVCPPKG